MRTIAGCIGLFFTMICGLAIRSGHADVGSGSATLKSAAPQFALRDQNGKNVALGQFINQFVVIEFMSTDCVYVRRHYKARTLQMLAEKYKEKNVAWIAVNSNRGSTPDRNRAWAAEYGVAYSILDDSALTLAKAYNVTKTPMIFIVDRAGNIVYLGAVDDDDSREGVKREGLRNYIDRALGELTGGGAVSIPETKPYGCDLNRVE